MAMPARTDTPPEASALVASLGPEGEVGSSQFGCQGAEKVAAMVTGEDLPVRGGGPPGGGDAKNGGQEKIESLAEDDGLGNLKDMLRRLDEMDAKRQEGLNAAAAAEGADDKPKARWRSSLMELMLKVDRAGNLRDVLGLSSEGGSGPSMGQPSVVGFDPGDWGNVAD